MRYIDITDEMINEITYNGNSPKFGVNIDGEDYIIKTPKAGDPYDTSVYSEYISSNLLRNCFDLYCQDVELGRYNGEVVDVIKDFTSNSVYELHSFRDTKQSSEDTDIGDKDYTYDDVLYLINKHLKMTDSEKEKTKNQFWNMFIADAICANRDRHWGNWGYLSYEGSYKTAPIYDNGSSLFPGVLRTINDYKDNKNRHQFVYDRVFTFPASLFRIRRPDRSYRSNYYEMFGDTDAYELFKKNVRNFILDNDWKDIFQFMRGITDELDIDVFLKRFYIEIVTLRYRCIVCREDFDSAYNEIEGRLSDVL